MAYSDKYEYYLGCLPGDIEKAQERDKKIVFGYTSNLDILLEWDVSTFNSILECYLKSEPELEHGEIIDSMEEFARIVAFYSVRGLGGEMDISRAEVCDYLECRFHTVPALGGTCAQGAGALGTIGFPVIAHLTDRSKDVCQLLDYPGVFSVNEHGLVPVIESATNAKPTKHLVLQYEKGDIVKGYGKEYVIPVSNRLILDFDAIHKLLPIRKDFLEYVEKNAVDFYSYSVSGFNLIVDLKTLSDRLGELEQHYSYLKKENPACILYLESAHYLSHEGRQMVFDCLAQQIDIIGMNEEELTDLALQAGVRTDTTNLRSVVRGLEAVICRYPVKGLVVHTKDYAMYYGERLEDHDIEKGLTLGNLMAGTKARIGYYGSLQECRETLSLPLSPAGQAFASELDSFEASRYICVVPSRYMKYPASTIGLGDTFVAGMQLGFVK